MRHDRPVAIIRVADGRLKLVRHPHDGEVIAFEDADAAFCFAVSLELGGGKSAGTVTAPAGVPLHILEAGAVATEVLGDWEAAA
jgi:hypothetical protein